MDNCIYCGAPVEKHSRGDHVIPAGFGEFRNALMFRRICRSCNSRIGQSEEQLLRCGPGWLLRHLVIPKTRRSRGRKRVSGVGARGAPPPEAWAHFSDHKEVVKQSDSGQSVLPFDQLVVYDENDNAQLIRLDPRMSPEALRQAVRRLGVTKISRITTHFVKENEEDYRRLISDTWPQAQWHEKPDRLPGKHWVSVQYTFTVTDHYFRSIAKIAFHYYLTQTGRVRGDEDTFSDLRNFILHGNCQPASEQFLLQDEVFRFRERFANVLPAWWHHVLAAREDTPTALAFVCLFYGPQTKGERYTLTLGKVPGRIILPQSSWAHAYNYYQPNEMEKYAGEVHRV